MALCPRASSCNSPAINPCSFAVIGYGYWGPNIVRNLISNDVEVKYVVDLDPKRREVIEKQHPSVIATDDADLVFNDSVINAVVIVLPANLHYIMSKKALESGKHVLVEKPLALSVTETNELISIAFMKKLVLMVDHTYLYSNAVRLLKKRIVEKNERIVHIESIRSNLGLFRRDVNVLWDLAPHDLSIIDYLTGELPNAVTATGSCHSQYGVCDAAHLFLQYPHFTANITVSWFSPEKIRSFQVITDKEMIVFDDTEKEFKIRCYDAGLITDDKFVSCYNNGYERLSCIGEEPLSMMLKDFIEAISTKKLPVSNSAVGLNVVRILEASDSSLKKDSSAVSVRE